MTSKIYPEHITTELFSVEIADLPFRYACNGFYIQSELEFPELISVKEEGILVALRIIFKPFNNVISNGLIYQISEAGFMLDIKNVARYLLKPNNELLVDPYEGADPSAIRLFILSAILSVLIYQNDMMAIHSSSVMIKDQAVIIAGDSGAGKSTVALGLHHKSYQILNDDITTVFFDDKSQPFVYPGNTHLRLWPKSLHDFGYKESEFQKIRPEIDKFSFPLLRSKIIDPIPLKAIFIINSEEIEEIEKTNLKGIELFENLKQNTFSVKLVKELKKEAVQFKLCATLANKIPVFKISRPKNIQSSDFVDYICKQLQEIN